MENHSSAAEDPALTKKKENAKLFKHFPAYGSSEGSSASDTCPTCQGTGRVPRAQENQLVAVIPCNDVRLKPRRTKLYVLISMAVCILICCLVLYFLFPRSVTLTPVSVLSVMVYFYPDEVKLEVNNLINITNENFVPVQISDFTMQGLIMKTVVGNTKVTNMTTIRSRAQQSYTVEIDLDIKDTGLNTYCKSTSAKIHTLFLQLQMTMNISYLSHTEQITRETFAYLDCGNNSTTPHPLN
ncbi:transmembrane protein 106A [Austrofundulus limnaeus]|uniref:Transmembrane protein 106A n=1 Tax=Austrofundulus limnaeus TaxID=52670 RepID=A0A2I4D7N8_AUSLI|nr:PREDICTED: transmembrane protein 106A [Austrofundulus limnaeus]